MDNDLNLSVSGDLTSSYSFAHNVFHTFDHPKATLEGADHIDGANANQARTTSADQRTFLHEERQNHMPRILTNKNSFQCKQCSSEFTRSGDLKRHTSSMHDRRKFVCGMNNGRGLNNGCGKSYTRRESLRKHQALCKDLVQPGFETRSDGNAIIQDAREAEQKRGNVIAMDSPIFSNSNSLVQSSSQQTTRNGHTCKRKKHTADPICHKCPLCGAQRDQPQLSSFLYHLLDHLENIHVQAFRCAACSASFGISEHLQVHQNTCKWTFGSGVVCPMIQVDVADKPVDWGCDIGIFDFETPEDRRRHVAALGRSDCAMHRVNIMKNMSSQLLSLMEVHIRGLQLREKGVVNQSTITLARQGIHALDIGMEKDRQSGEIRLQPYQRRLASDNYKDTMS